MTKEVREAVEKKTRILVVDDHPLIIQGITFLIKQFSRAELLGSFQTGNAVLEFLKTNEVDLVLLDVSLPDMNGMDLCLHIKAIQPKALILGISNHTERNIIMQMLQNGASGYLLKNASIDELKKAYCRITNGKTAFSDEVMRIIAQPSASDLKCRPKFTKREKQVLKLIAEGKTTTAIAETLFLSPLTVETHRRNMMQKLNVKNSIELINLAHEQLLI